MIKAVAFAKINLTLQILGRKKDGFHLIDSITSFCHFGDQIEVIVNNSSDDLEITGPFASELEGPNIVTKTLEYFRYETGWLQPIKIKIDKNIPIAAGLGGGSANAAAVLKLLNMIAPVPKITKTSMYKIALDIGADVPACLESRTIRMGGIGEQLISIGKLPQISVLLVNPKVKLLTKDVFASVFKNNSSPFEVWQPRATAHEIFRTIGSKAPNDLIGSAIKHAPAIRQVLDALDQLTGVKTIGMSGSGATCFALFDPNDTNDISIAEEIMISRGWWTAKTSLRA